MTGLADWINERPDRDRDRRHGADPQPVAHDWPDGCYWRTCPRCAADQNAEEEGEVA